MKYDTECPDCQAHCRMSEPGETPQIEIEVENFEDTPSITTPCPLCGLSDLTALAPTEYMDTLHDAYERLGEWIDEGDTRFDTWREWEEYYS